MFCVFGCSQIHSSKSAGDTEKQDYASITLGNLIYVDMFSAEYTTQHPRVCEVGGDFPTGQELAFRYVESRKSIHAVFPEGVTAPKNLNGNFVLHGHFQGIQNMDRYKVKKPEKDYRYFVVSSWEYKK